MSTFVVPDLDEEPWPTLGPQVRDLIQERAIHGPGDLRGEPPRIDAEVAALIDRSYQVYPRGHPRAGRRRFKRVAWSMRKGSAKTEKAAWVMFAELHPEGPVRCDGFRYDDGMWKPVGRPITDPYIPMLAYTEEQVEELAYGALLCICTEGPDADLFDAGLERITRVYGDGKAEAVAGSPSATDGARTTCQHLDETHRMILPRLKAAVQTMRMNLPKRVLADAWQLETSTTYAEGEGSAAQDTHEYAEKVAAGKVTDRTIFFFHRQAAPRDGEDLADVEQRKAAVREASGPALLRWPHAEEQVESIAAMYDQPDTDKAYWERVWLNRRVSSSRLAFDPGWWTKELARPEVRIGRSEPVVLGFDGARWRDACGIIATHIETGFQWPHAAWEKPEGPAGDGWEITDEQVDGALAEAMDLYLVRLVYADPPRFESNVARWAGRWGEKRVFEWYTNRPRQIGQAMRAYGTAQSSRELTHSGDALYAKHVANSRKRSLPGVRDDDDTPLWTIEKERPDSTKFIDLAMAGCLSWQARLDALAKGGWQKRNRTVTVHRR